MKKLKESGSISDSERLNMLSSDEIEQENLFGSTDNPVIELSGMKTPFKSPTHETEVTILSTSPPTPKLPSASHDKPFYDDRFNDSVFDPFLARSCLPKMIVSIGGMLMTGFFLNIIISWKVFTNVPELFVIIPVIFNLRGILENGLTSRLTKASRIGVMDSISGRKKIWLGNLNLVMFQSITAGLFAGLMSCFLSWLSDPKGLQIWRCVLMVVVAAATTASSSVISGFFLFLVLQAFKRLKMNPDDLLGPLTSSFGGAMSLFILAIYAGFFYLWMGSWIGVAGVVLLLIVANGYFYVKAQRNEAVGTLTSEGWPSMLFSLLVTGLSGLLLQRFISEYQSVFALLLPVFTGITGSFAGIYSSEAMTHLHLFQLNPVLPRKTALTLLILSNPVQIVLVLLIGFLNREQISISLPFIVSYLIAENVQVLLLIALADCLIKMSWKLSLKPESNVPALMSTLSDFSGTLVLVFLFYVLKHTGNLSVSVPVPVEIAAAAVINNVADSAVKAIAKNAETITETITDTITAAVTATAVAGDTL